MQPTSTTGQSGQSHDMASMPMATPMDLFVHELSDMLSAEQLITQMLRVASDAASNAQLKQGLQHHQEETQRHAQNLQQALQVLGQQPHPVTCHAAEGLMQSLQEGIQSSQSNIVTDGLIAAGAIKTENLEIASYMGLVQKAQLMGQTEVAQLLQQNLEQEERMLQRGIEIGQALDQQSAQSMGGMAMQDQMGSSAQV
jgi:ferritin-like metal-binding protein YciE